MALAIKLARFTAVAILLAASWSARGQVVDVTANVHIEAPVSAKHLSPANVVVWLTPLDSTLPPPVPAQHVRLVQKNKEFTPHLLVVPTGTSVDFPNMDPFFHNVFSLFNGKRFDLGLYETNTHRAVSFDREGVSYIFCNIHPEMGAIVVSLTTPYYAISKPDGSIVLHGVSPGRYRLQTWAEQLQSIRTADETVQISPKNMSIGTLTFVTSADAISHHKNKFGKDYPAANTSQY